MLELEGNNVFLSPGSLSDWAWLADCTMLTSLTLSRCSRTGTIDDLDFSALQQLTELRLIDNPFSRGSLPKYLARKQFMNDGNAGKTDGGGGAQRRRLVFSEEAELLLNTAQAVLQLRLMLEQNDWGRLEMLLDLLPAESMTTGQRNPYDQSSEEEVEVERKSRRTRKPCKFVGQRQMVPTPKVPIPYLGYTVPHVCS